MRVAESRDSVFAPAIRPRSRVIVRQIIPSIAIRAVIFANRAPLALREIRPPARPVRLPVVIVLDALFFRSHRPLRRHWPSRLNATCATPRLESDPPISPREAHTL